MSIVVTISLLNFYNTLKRSPYSTLEIILNFLSYGFINSNRTLQSPFLIKPNLLAASSETSIRR